MNFLLDAMQLLFEPDNWTGTTGLGARTLEHLVYTVIAILLSCLLALPLGFAIGYFGRGKNLAVAFTGVVRAIPTLGLLTLVALSTGLGLTAPMVAFVTLAVPSIVAGAYSGVESVSPETVDAARAQGMNGLQILFLVHIPLGLPLIIGGIRLAVLQVVGTATIAAYVGSGGLGVPLFAALRTNDYTLLLASALVVIALAIVLDSAFEVIQRSIRRLPGFS